MVECPVCGEVDFVEVAGHFYCTTCNTQSQDARVMEVDVESISSFPSHSLAVRNKKNKKPEPPRKASGKPSPFSIHQLYEAIVLKQVEALIELGAKPELKNVVFKLWANYLAKLGVAFKDQDSTQALLKYRKTRKDFIFKQRVPGTAETLSERKRKPHRVKKVRKIKKYKSKEIVSSSSSEEEKSLDEADSDIEDRAESDPESESDSESDTERVLRRFALTQEWKQDYAYRSVFKMQMILTLCFCYLGLMATNPVTTMNDLLRWVKQGKIPYTLARDILPPRMAEWNQRMNIITSHQVVPSREEFRRRLVRIGRHLGLKDRHINSFPITELIHKYIYQLDLPAEMHGLAVKLVELEDLRLQRLLYWEVIAMAPIVLILKLYLGLNDQTERLFSNYSRDLNKLYYKGEEKLFVYDRWIAHVADKIELLLPKVAVSENQVVDKEVLGVLGKPVPIVKPHRHGERRLDPEFKKALQKPFVDLTSRWLTTETRDNDGVAGDDDLGLSQRSMIDDSTVGLLIGLEEESEPDVARELSTFMGRKSRLSEERVRQRGETFRKSSIKHLLDPKEFVEQHEECNEDDHNDVSVDKDDEKVKYSEKDVFKNVVKHCDFIKERYVISESEKKGKISKQSASYRWLSHLLCKFIDCRPKELLLVLSGMERQISPRHINKLQVENLSKQWVGENYKVD